MAAFFIDSFKYNKLTYLRKAIFLFYINECIKGNKAS